MRRTIKQAVDRIAKPPGARDVATIVDIDILATDNSGAVLAVSPSMVINVHGIGGIKRAEFSAGIDATKLHLGDQVLVEQVRDRYIITGLMPLSNRTQGGGQSHGNLSSSAVLGTPIVSGIVAGSQLELSWAPIAGATQYEIWQSSTADPQSDDARLIATTPSARYVSMAQGSYFDAGTYYSVTALGAGNTAGNMSDWIQPEFIGNYASGMTSKNQTTNIPGSLTVTKGGSILRADASSLDSPQVFDLDVCDPQGTHPTTAPFSVDDILRMVDANGNALWVKVSTTKDKHTFWRYKVVKQSPSAGTNYIIKSGAAVANWGQSGQGVFLVSADGTFGAGTLWAIVTHVGDPWNTYTVQVSGDSTGKLLFAAGNGYLDSAGATVIASGAEASARAFKFLDGGGNELGGLYAIANSGGANLIVLRAKNVATFNNKLNIVAAADSLLEADIFLTAQRAGQTDVVLSVLNSNALGNYIGVSGGAFTGDMDTMAYASTLSLDVFKGNLHKTTTVNATGNATINASAVGIAGQEITVLIVNDATSGKVITFGTNFKPNGTLTGTASKGATVKFASDGISWYEVSRTLGL